MSVYFSLHDHRFSVLVPLTFNVDRIIYLLPSRAMNFLTQTRSFWPMNNESYFMILQFKSKILYFRLWTVSSFSYLKFDVYFFEVKWSKYWSSHNIQSIQIELKWVCRCRNQIWDRNSQSVSTKFVQTEGIYPKNLCGKINM